MTKGVTKLFIDWKGVNSPHVAKSGWYKNHHYRAETEHKMMQALDIFGIKWEYEPKNYQLSNGLWYRPDFWLPEAKMFIECKGEQTPKAMGKAYGLVYDTEYPVLIAGYDWIKLFKYYFNICPSSADEQVIAINDGLLDIVNYDSGIILVKCAFCGKWWFTCYEDSYQCQCCNSYDGDATLGVVHEITGINDIFNLSQDYAAAKYQIYCN